MVLKHHWTWSHHLYQEIDASMDVPIFELATYLAFRFSVSCLASVGVAQIWPTKGLEVVNHQWVQEKSTKMSLWTFHLFGSSVDGRYDLPNFAPLANHKRKNSPKLQWARHVPIHFMFWSSWQPLDVTIRKASFGTSHPIWNKITPSGGLSISTHNFLLLWSLAKDVSGWKRHCFELVCPCFVSRVHVDPFGWPWNATSLELFWRFIA